MALVVAAFLVCRKADIGLTEQLAAWRFLALNTRIMPEAHLVITAAKLIRSTATITAVVFRTDESQAVGCDPPCGCG
jgi:hypothetical protein